MNYKEITFEEAIKFAMEGKHAQYTYADVYPLVWDAIAELNISDYIDNKKGFKFRLVEEEQPKPFCLANVPRYTHFLSKELPETVISLTDVKRAYYERKLRYPNERI